MILIYPSVVFVLAKLMFVCCYLTLGLVTPPPCFCFSCPFQTEGILIRSLISLTHVTHGFSLNDKLEYHETADKIIFLVASGYLKFN